MRFLQNILMIAILLHYCDDSCAQVSKKFFRSDYTYFDSTQSFYKIHTIHKTWQEAKKTCFAEGSSFFYPEDGNEADVVREFIKQTQPYDWVFVGASAIMAKGVYETIEGVPVQNLYHKWSPGEPNDGYPQDCMILRREGTVHDENCAVKYPFICKKSLSSLKWNQFCSMPNIDYEFNEDFGRCYKFHLNPLNWQDAYAACSAEQSYLAVIDSQAEANYLTNLTAKAPKESIVGDYTRGVVHVGFHNRTDDGWINIKGVPLSESGYSKWGANEPNGAGRELCGTMFYDGTLNDADCQVRSFFICEHDIATHSSAIDVRLLSTDDDNKLDGKSVLIM